VVWNSTPSRFTWAVCSRDLVTTDQLIARTAELGADAGEPDVGAVLKELSAARARVARDLSALEVSAAGHEAFGAAEGIAAKQVECTDRGLWLEAPEVLDGGQFHQLLAPRRSSRPGGLSRGRAARYPPPG
jgi:hypothetical protein